MARYIPLTPTLSRWAREKSLALDKYLLKEEVVRNMAGRILEAFGYSAVRVTNGREALDCYAESLKSDYKS